MSENDERRKRVSRLQQIKDESEVDEATKRIMNLSLESEEQNSTNFLAKRIQKASSNTSTSGPQRFQISRIDVDPPNTVRVCSPSPWSNPFRIGVYNLTNQNLVSYSNYVCLHKKSNL